MNKIMHYPNLKTILMIEDILKESNISLSKNEIMRRMPKKIMRQTFNVAIDYLTERNIVFYGDKGVTWIFNQSKKLNNALKKGTIH